MNHGPQRNLQVCIANQAFKNLKKGTKKKGIRKMEVPGEEPVTSREAKITCVEIK